MHLLLTQDIVINDPNDDGKNTLKFTEVDQWKYAEIKGFHGSNDTSRKHSHKKGEASTQKRVERVAAADKIETFVVELQGGGKVLRIQSYLRFFFFFSHMIFLCVTS